MYDLEFFNGKRIFLTGHTGFKGTWICQLLKEAGAILTGYALAPATSPNLFELLKTDKGMTSIIADIRDLHALTKAILDADPQIVIHMAAQPLVRASYEDPVYTYETNVMGTVHILEAIRKAKNVRSFVNVTTDKVYRNNEWHWGYRETDVLCGYDPYSNSKSCSELVTDSYKNSFFDPATVAISTVRAGNVIGGGDFSTDRIIPDCVRAAASGREIIVRNPHSIRPYQHVLEPVTAYLEIAKRQYEDPSLAGCYNIGPGDEDCVTTGRLAALFCEEWGGASWNTISEENAVHEASFLKLDCSKVQGVFGIKPVWHIREAVRKTVEWAKCHRAGSDVAACIREQVFAFLEEATQEKT